MKKALLLTVLFFVFISVSNSQVLDTVNTYGFGKMPPVYFANKLYWEKNYEQTKSGEGTYLSFEGLSYNSCHVGTIVIYYPNGKIKATGHYKENTTGDWSDLEKRGLCNVQDGEWKEFLEDGTLSKTYLYENGKVVKEY